MRVQFVKDFDWSPAEYGGRVTLAFKAGPEFQVVRRVCGEAAVAAGHAIDLTMGEDNAAHR
jgi:hypothetical protein